MAKSYAVILDGPIGMSHVLSRYADALYLIKLLSPEGQRVLGEILGEYDIPPEFDAMLKLLQRNFKKRFDEAAFQKSLDEPTLKVSDGEQFLDLKEFAAREAEVKRVDWDAVFLAFNMLITPVPMRHWHWTDDFPDFPYLPSPIKSGDIIRIDAPSEVLHVCPRSETQLELVERLYGGEEQELENVAPNGIVVKVDWVDTYTVGYTPSSPKPQQVYIVSGHIEWERLDPSVRAEMFEEMEWSQTNEPYGIAIAYLYTRGDEALKVLETVDGRDFTNPTKMILRAPESEWTVEVFLRDGDVLSLACDVQRPDFSSHFPDAGDALKKMHLPEIYYSIYPVNEYGLDDEDEEDEEGEDFRTLFAIFGFLKDGQFALRYLSGGDTQMFVDANTKTVQIELLMKINIWGGEVDEFEIERLDPLGNLDELLDAIDESEDETDTPKPLPFEKSAWWQSYLQDLSKLDEEPKPKGRKKSGDEPKKGRKKPKDGN